MNRFTKLVSALAAMSVASLPAQAFRNCERLPDDRLYRGTSGYQVSELEFDPISRVATCTETHYNFSNRESGGVAECHVTYELNGVYDEASALFLLDADRRNQSVTCDGDSTDVQFPDYLSYSLLVRLEAGDRVLVSRAESGEVLARGDWNAGNISYKTDENCRLD